MLFRPVVFVNIRCTRYKKISYFVKGERKITSTVAHTIRFKTIEGLHHDLMIQLMIFNLFQSYIFENFRGLCTTFGGVVSQVLLSVCARVVRVIVA